MRQFFLLLTFSFFLNNISGQSYKQTVIGKVTDTDSKSPIPGANIVILNSDTITGTTTDANGKFRLENIPVGRHSIKVSLVGYQETIINDIIVSSGKETVLLVEL